VLLDGAPVLFMDRGARAITTLREPEEEWLAPALGALAGWIRADRRRRAAIERVDGEPVHDTAAAPLLERAGFRSELRAMVLRA
jgi:ATP-dependent helicase Lhr and Lhr-like helicase